MRGLATWLVAGAVVALAVVAIADGIRSRATASPRTEASPFSSLHGLLVIADPSCEPEALRLPGLSAEQPPKSPDCGGETRSGDGTLVARCHKGVTSVTSADGHIRFADIRGCAPAWRPDGALSVVRDGAIVVTRRRGPERVFLTRDQLSEPLRTLVERSETYSVAEVRWFGLSGFVALVRGERPWETAAVVFAQGGLETFFPQFGGHIEDLRATPLGNFAFARTDPGRQYVMVSRGGKEITIPRIANARAIAWSPDEAWVAIGTRNAVFIAKTGTEEVVARVPVGARALDWLP